jgi:hypothetical protein
LFNRHLENGTAAEYADFAFLDDLCLHGVVGSLKGDVDLAELDGDGESLTRENAGGALHFLSQDDTASGIGRDLRRHLGKGAMFGGRVQRGSWGVGKGLKGRKGPKDGRERRRRKTDRTDRTNGELGTAEVCIFRWQWRFAGCRIPPLCIV